MRQILKRLLCPLFIFLLVFSLIVSVFAEGESEPFESKTENVSIDLNLTSQCALLMDAASGRVLYEKDADVKRPIASITKIMTCLIVLENCEDLDAVIRIKPEWAAVDGSSMYLDENDLVSIRALLYGLMLNSGNDAAVALACTIAGDEETFVGWMNARAASLGMNSTHFSNPHGLDAADHYSTAHDMALVMNEAMKNDIFCEICATRYIKIDGFELYYHNKLLDKYEYCVGGKTGYTENAGNTLVTAAVKNDQLLIAVTLNGDSNEWNDHISLFEYGFSNYPLTAFCIGGETYAHIPISNCEQSMPLICCDSFVWPVGRNETVRAEVNMPEQVLYNVPKNAVLGDITYYINEDAFRKIYLITGVFADVDTGEVSQSWKNEFKRSFPLAGLFPDVQQSNIYGTDGLRSTALLHTWA